MPNPLTILPPVPTRGQAYAGVLSQIFATRQANQQAEEDRRTNAVKTALAPYAGQPLLLAKALQFLAPEDRARAQKAGIGMVTPMESPEQTLARVKAAALTQDITGAPAAQSAPEPSPAAAGTPQTPQSVAPAPQVPVVSGALANNPVPSQVPDMPPIGAGAGIGAPPAASAGPTPNDIVDAKARHFEAMYGHAPATEQLKQWYDMALLGPQGQVTARQMETKIVPTADEQTKNDLAAKIATEATIPQSQATVGNLKSETAFRNGPQTAETRAKTIEAGTASSKNVAETALIKEKVKEAADSNDPVVRKAGGMAVVAEVVANPRSFESLTPKEKALYFMVTPQAPVKLSVDERNRTNAAQYGLNTLTDVKTIMDKWHQRGMPLNGPILGRFNDVTGKFGDFIIPPNVPAAMRDEYAHDISQEREWIETLPIQEAKALIGGRPPQSAMTLIRSVSPRLSESDAMFAGSLDGMTRRYEQLVAANEKKVWGPNGPPRLGGGSATPGTAGGPIQTYIGADGKIHVR